ncbi:hypothetical protein ONZ45_g14915 [Pleurotus djamor]|nr:hypothetical protein ONZ45_g14915 [Pleurotus djamor]
MAALRSVCLNIHTIPRLIFLSIVFQIPPIISGFIFKYTRIIGVFPPISIIPQVHRNAPARPHPGKGTTVPRIKQADIHNRPYQAVKSLCEIWHPQDIPTVFLTSSRATVPTLPTPTPSITKLTRDTYRRNVQLPSPISPSTHESPSPISTPSPACWNQFNPE